MIPLLLKDPERRTYAHFLQTFTDNGDVSMLGKILQRDVTV
jgi:hypothetical protein